MASYYIIGGDTKEYGPIPAEDVRLWIREGRLNTQSLAKGDGDKAWRTLGSFPEFAAELHTTPPTIAPLKPGYSAAAPASTDFLERDYELDIGGCVTRGWDMVKDNMGIFVVAALIYGLIEFAAWIFSYIPLIGPVFSLANFVISGPLLGGFMYLFLRGARGEAAQAGDMFSGFKRSFAHLFLATLVTGLLTGLCLLPFIILFAVKYAAAGIHFDPNTIQTDPAALQQFAKNILSLLVATFPVLLIGALPAMYLSVSWKFTLPLVIDKGMDFWTAMKTSFKMVNKHWFQVFGLIILIDVLNAGGTLLCGVGWLITMPIGMAALMFAYETIFGSRKN